MKRKLLLTFISLISALCLLIGVSACSTGAKLVDFSDKSIEIGYGTTYNLELAVSDEDGNIYGLTADVKTTDGKDVPVVNGKFNALDKGGYVIKYTLSKGKRTFTRTVTAKVVATVAPVINVTGLGGYLIPDMPYEIPAATVYDYFDGEIGYSVEVYKKSTDGKDVKVDFDVENGVYNTTETGEFYVLYSAKNSGNVSNTYKLDLSVVEKETLVNLAVLTENNSDLIYNKDIVAKEQAYLTAESEELQAISGSYDGNARRFKIYTNPNFNLKCSLNAQVIKAMAKHYNSITMWVAVKGITEGNAFMMAGNGVTKSIQLSASGGQMGLKDKQDKWIKLVAPTIDVASFDINGEFLKLFNIWCNETYKGDDARVYVGDVKFENMMSVTNKDINRNYYTEYDWKTDGITGDYSGDAIKFSGGTNSGFKYQNAYSETELIELSKTYNNVKLNVAFNFTGGALFLYTSGFEGIANPGQTDFSSAKGNLGKWLGWVIPIKDYIELVAANEYEYFYPWGNVEGQNAYSLGVTSEHIDYYFGAVEFIYIEPTVINVNESNYTNLQNPSMTLSYMSASDLSALGISGDYDGNATRFTINIAVAATNAEYRVKVPYTAAELTALKEKYNTVTTWVCATGVLTKSLAVDGTKNNLATIASAKSFGVQPTWQKLSISMDDFISLVGDSGICPLLATSGWNGGTYDTVNGLHIYFGNVIFEYVTA